MVGEHSVDVVTFNGLMGGKVCVIDWTGAVGIDVFIFIGLVCSNCCVDVAFCTVDRAEEPVGIEETPDTFECFKMFSQELETALK